MIIIFAGFSGSGKSYISKKISNYFKCPYLNSDKIRKDIAHIASTNHVFEKYGEGIYSRRMTELTYKTLITKAKKLREKEDLVIIDATFISRDMQKKLLELGKDFIFFWCYTTDEIIKERLEKRLKEKENISDATWEIYLKQKENFKGFIIPEDRIFKIDTSDVKVVDKVIEIIRGYKNE